MPFKFRLLRGSHVQKELQKDGTKVLKVYNATNGKNIVVSETDLAAKFNKVGSMKFEPIGPSAPTPITKDVKNKVFATATIEELRELLAKKEQQKQPEQEPEYSESQFIEDEEKFNERAQEIEDSENEDTNEYHSKELHEMSKSELVQYASDYAVDISGLTKKQDILEKIVDTLAAENSDESEDVE